MNNRSPQTGEERSARWLVWGLVVICIGVPVVVELITLSGLVTNRLMGEGASADSSEVTAPVARVGTYLLPGSALRATLTEARVVAGAKRWTFALELDVQNSADTTCALRIGPVETKGRTVLRETTTRRWAGGETGTLRAQWTLPPGEEPAYLSVRARRIGAADSMTVQRRVRLGKVPVRAGGR